MLLPRIPVITHLAIVFALQTSFSLQDQCSTISFLSYFPCTTATSLAAFEECDVFAYVAAQLAADRIRQNHMIPVNVTLIPFETGQVVDIPNVSFQTSEYFANHDTSCLRGVVGPADPELTQLYAPLTDEDHMESLGVTYGASGAVIDEEQFFRGIPSSQFIDEATIELIAMFGWSRVGVIFSKESTGTSQAFGSVFESSGQGKIVVNLGFRDAHAIDVVLQELVQTNLRIFVGMFGPLDARTVLCRASQFGLTTSEHVWILPSYYNPNWWVLDEGEPTQSQPGDNCSNADMIDIVNSALFVAGIKYPRLMIQDNLSDEKFHELVLEKTMELFPTLNVTKSDSLRIQLLASQAPMAYEAVWLLTLAWSDAEPSGSYSVAFRSLQRLMACELCAVLDLTDTEEQLQSYCGPSCSNASGELNSALVEALDKYYGEVIVSQFVNGIHCPIGLYIPDVVKHQYVGLPIFNLTRFGCPLDFWWKGRSDPPSGDFPITYSNIGVASLVLVVIIILLCLIYAAMLMFVNVYYREKKYIKASSPKLNTIIITGFVISLLVPLFLALVVSAHEYGISPGAGDVLCQCIQWTLHAPKLLYVILLVKNARIYWIFHNPKLKTSTTWLLSDHGLFLFAVVLVLPTLILLVVQSAIDHYQYVEYIVNTDATTTCRSEHALEWFLAEEIYYLLLAVVLIFLAYQNSRVHSRFKHEGEAAYLVLMTAIIIEPCISLVYTVLVLEAELSLYLQLYWVAVIYYSVFPAFLLSVLFAPKLYLLYIDHRMERKVIEKDEEREIQHQRFTNLLRQRENLTRELNQKTNKLHKLRAERKALNNLTVTFDLEVSKLNTEEKATQRGSSTELLEISKPDDTRGEFTQIRSSTELVGVVEISISEDPEEEVTQMSRGTELPGDLEISSPKDTGGRLQ